MKAEKLIWSLICLATGIYLVIRASSGDGMAKVYVEREEKTLIFVAAPSLQPDGSMQMTEQWVREGSAEADGRTAADSTQPTRTVVSSVFSSPRAYRAAVQADPQQTRIMFSWQRTIGTWVAALLTLFIFSLLYKDNPFYKLAESIVVGVSAAYVMVNAFWAVIIPNLLARLMPFTIKNWAQPGLSGDDLTPDYYYIIPLILGVMLLWRLAPKGQWIARWPLALFIGVFAGLRLVQYIQADFVEQINSAIVPLIAVQPSGGSTSISFAASLKNCIMVFGTLACLVYFFFSIEHKGAVGKAARTGVWILMITFGAMFGYTVMGRIALLAARLEFLFNDWLWFIDPTGDRAVALLM